jgi:hypothetical protein
MNANELNKFFDNKTTSTYKYSPSRKIIAVE